MSKESFLKKKKEELVLLCKEKGLPVSGTKQDLVARIFGEAAPAKKSKKPALVQKTTFPCHKLISKSFIRASKNEYGNYEDPITNLVFDRESKLVIGKQAGPDVVKLSINDVKFCHEKGLQFDQKAFDGNFATKDGDIEDLIEKIIMNADNISDDEDDDEELA